MNTFNLNLDLDKTSGIIQWVTLRQGDKNGTQLRATIYDHGTPVTGSYTARFSLRHPGTGDTYYRETATYSNGVATVTVDEQYAATVTGITAGYFELLQGSTVIASTADFGVRILASATDGAVPGEVYDSAIEDALEELDEATGRINQMVVDATEEYLNAHPELTTTVEDNSLTDAKLIQHGGILSRVDRLMYRLDNLLTNTPAEAESVTVTDAAKTPVAGLALYGKSTQDGTPTPSAPVPIQSVTPNLIPYPYNSQASTSGGVTWTVNADGTITANGTATANSYFVIHRRATFVSLPAGTYTLSGSPNVGSVAIRIQYNDASGVDQSPSNTSGVPVTFTADTNLEIPEGNYSLFCYVPNGTTVTNAVFRPMLVQGSIANSYVPYGHAGLLANGKNLLNGTSVSSTSSGVTRSYDGSTNVLSMSGTATANNTDLNIQLAKPILVPEGGTLTLSLSGSVSINAPTQFITFLHDPIGGYSEYHNIANSSHSATFTTLGGKVVNVIKLRVGTGTGAISINANLQLELGSTATAYQPYVESVTPIPLDGHTLRSLPDGTHDEVTVDERGHVTLTQRVGTYTTGVGYTTIAALSHLAGAYRFYHSYGNMDAAATDGANRNVGGLCTIGHYEQDSSVAAGIPHFYAYDKRIYYIVSDTEVTDENSAIAWINNHPMTINYRLATPVTYDLGTIDPTALVGPDMTATGIPTAPFALTYERDLNATLARLEAAIADAATA